MTYGQAIDEACYIRACWSAAGLLRPTDPV
jgi:hypothetical protein